MNFKDEFYQKLKLLVLPIAIQNFMLALVSATDAIMLGWIDQTSLSAVSLAGQVQFVLSLFISGIAAGAGIMAAQYWGKQDAASIEKVIPIALRTNLLFSGLFTILAGFCAEMLMHIFKNDAALVASGSQYLRAVALSYVLSGTASSLPQGKYFQKTSGATRFPCLRPPSSGELPTFCTPLSWATWEAMLLQQTRLPRLQRASSPA